MRNVWSSAGRLGKQLGAQIDNVHPLRCRLAAGWMQVQRQRGYRPRGEKEERGECVRVRGYAIPHLKEAGGNRTDIEMACDKQTNNVSHTRSTQVLPGRHLSLHGVGYRRGSVGVHVCIPAIATSTYTRAVRHTRPRL